MTTSSRADRPGRRLLAWLLAALGVALATACAPQDSGPAASPRGDARPPSANAVPVAALRRYGGLYREGGVAAYVDGVGHRLVEANALGSASWRFSVLNSPDVNAFATDRGDVFVTRGLLSVLQDEAELAAVMGHEMGHVLARHAAQRRAQEAQVYQRALQVARSTRDPQLALAFAEMELAQARAYSREQEFEADRIAVRLVVRAGYDSEAAVRSLERLQDYTVLHARMLGLPPDAPERQGRFSTHPRTVDRVEAARVEAGAPNGGRRGAEAYLDAIDGMLFGDTPQEGFARGRHFVHPGLGFGFDAPPGYTLVNGAQSVRAYGPDKAFMMFACTSRAPEGDMVESMRRLFPSVPLADPQTLTIDGLDAATGVTPRSAASGDTDGRVVTIRFPPGMCTFLLVSRRSGPAARAQELYRAARTFRRLSPAEAAQARPLRLRVVTARPGDTPERLAARSPADENLRLERFLVLNALHPGDRLTPGQRVRIVVAE
jgi:predicted Zn-dependent protease